jgi:nucleoid-associated protein YgaU
MPSMDKNGPRSFSSRRTRSRRSTPFLRLSASGLILLSAAAFTAPVSRAQDQTQNQDVAQAARQERARRQEQQKKDRHVYTNEDLKRSHILTREDQAAVEARKNECAKKNNCGPAQAQKPVAPLDANSGQRSLGEVAREYRQQKELNALKPKQSEPFHLSIGTPALAAPIVPEHSAIRPPVQPAIGPGSHVNSLRRDPFAPVPARPRVPLNGKSELRPANPPAARVVDPAAPKISSRATSGPKLIEHSSQPARPEEPGLVAEPSKPSSPALKIETVRPVVPKTRRAIPVAPSANIFSAPKPAAPSFSAERPVAPFEFRSVKPSQPVTRSAQPVAPVEKVRPMQPSQPLASATVPAKPPASFPAPAAPSRTSAAATKTIRIEPGDSLWKIARQNFGRGELWNRILAANPTIADPSRIRAGAKLSIPATAEFAAAGPASAPMRTIKVQKGDSLWTLAKTNLGSSSNWPCLAAANTSIADPNRIFEGQELVVPPTCHAASNSALLPDEK